MLALIDTHAHLADPRLATRIDSVLETARLAGVVQIIAIGTTATDSAICVEMSKVHRGIFVAVGIHPNDWSKARDGDWALITQLAALEEVVAIGETGLDRHWNDTPFDQQREALNLHLELAGRLDKPVSIHCRECEEELIAHLRGWAKPIRGVLHSFCGTLDQAEAFLEIGLHLSFAGMLTFANKSLDPLREAARHAPLDRILVETDSPYLSPHPMRGKHNEPGRVAITAGKLAEVREITHAELAEATTRNAQRLFGLGTKATL